MPTISLPSEWRPRQYQRGLWDYLEGGGKRAVAIWHRRAGKDSVCLNRTAVAAHERVASYWHMLPQANQARKAIWEAVNPHTGVRLIDQAFPREIRETTRENDMLIRFRCGSSWQVVGSDNFNSLVGSPPAGVVFSEYALADPQAWAFLRPILQENGGWALFITTPRGRNHAQALLKLAEKEPGWFAQVLPADQTGVFSVAQLEQERRELIAEHGEVDGQSLFDQEYRCSFDAAIVGAYFAAEMRQAEADNRIAGVPWEPRVKVHTAWDLGFDDATAIWFVQQVGKELHLIDYYEASGQGLPHYASVLRSKPYAYGDHLLPHDSEVRELGTGKSRVETLQGLGIQPTVVPMQEVPDGINAARLMLPRCWIDKTKCERGIDALKAYRREWDEDRKIFRDKPLHDWASHAADAFRYLALGLRPDDGGWGKPLTYNNKWVV